MALTPQEIADAIRILNKVEPSEEDANYLMGLADKLTVPEALDLAYTYRDGSEMTPQEDQLLRESDERAAFNDQLDNLRNER